MTSPTPLSPWFVVFRHAGDLEYYTHADDGPMWWTGKTKAMMFMSLASALRVAKAEAADILVLWDREKAHEFGRGD